MNHKTIVKVAIAMLIVFGATVLLYPLMFNPDAKNRNIEAPPIKEPVSIPTTK